MARVLVISPHPDDESIGCGGTVCSHVAQNDEVYVVFLTSGEKGGHGKIEKETIMLREKEAREATNFLKIKGIEFWRQPDGNILVTENLIHRLTDKVKEINPGIIYVPHENEQHPDHQAAAALVVNTLNHLTQKPDVLMYEVWTPIQKIDHIVDITPFIENKRKAILFYKSQCEVMDFDDAILGLNRYRGEMHCWPEGEYAEVFKFI